jgi:subtilisin family serine protease
VAVALLVLAAILPGCVDEFSTPYVLEPESEFPTDLAELVEAAGGVLTGFYPEAGIATAVSDDPNFPLDLEVHAEVRSATPDLQVQWMPVEEAAATTVFRPGPDPSPGPADAVFFPCQWNLAQIDAPGAWAQGEFGDPDVKVAVLDTGIDFVHRDLAGRVDLWNSKSVLSPGSSPCGSVDDTTIVDFHFHGTFVASQITTNSIGMAGVAPNAQIVAVKVLNCFGSGFFGDIITGIIYAATLDDVDVINMSFGSFFPKSDPGAGRLVGALNKAVNFANSRGKLVVGAAGNDGVDLDQAGNFTYVPAGSGAGIASYATTVDDQLASYSNFGRSAT